MSSSITRRRWLAAAAGWPACARARAPVPAAAAGAPLLEGFDGHRFPVDSTDPLLRCYYDQGVLLQFGFNPAEAARSFAAVTRLDPQCAGGWWALAWALGPNINSDMAAASAAVVDDALRRARRCAARSGALQAALIEALALRHPAVGVVDEPAYAQRMRELARRHPRDAMVALLAAESLLNLHPYDWWTDDGAARPWTPEIEALLAHALTLRPLLPGADHYWIHLQEGSRHPARALPSAHRLVHAVPGSGHLLHMPSHVFMRVGRYDDAIRSNQRAIEADRRYLAQVDVQGAYRVGYVAHNHDFLWAAAGMAGRRRLALDAAQAALPAACGAAGSDRSSAIVQQYAVLPYFTRVRFGLWRELLHDTLPPDTPGAYPLAIWHYAQGTALVRTGRIDEAARALERLESTAASGELQGLRIKQVNPASAIVRIAVATLRADLGAARGDPRAALAGLAQATHIEDALAADEPHLWLAPTRHALGAGLLAADQPAQAERVYREDLAHYPDNGWSLGGLALALERQQRPQAARAAAGRARAAFHGAEALPAGSRF
ncbi:MAG: hypothetical protein KGN16_03840 [Burkholderiales bacterium]|nr:hypothetical protein [Burkholderiales bacterium]